MSTLDSMNTQMHPQIKTIAQLKADGRASILGYLPTLIIANIGYIAASYVLTGLVSNVVSGVTLLSVLASVFLSFLVSLMVGIVRYGLYSLYLNRQFEQTIAPADLYRGFREQPDRIIKVEAAFAAVESLALLPFTLFTYRQASITDEPVKSLVLLALGYLVIFTMEVEFAPIWFLMLDFPEMKEKQLFVTSARMMRGHRKQYVLLTLSFLPLYFLGFLSFGIALLWVMAYRYASYAAFYRGLVSQYSYSGD